MNESLVTSQAGVDLIKKWEGLHDGNKKTSLVEPMADPVGIPTIGWGCTYYENGKKVTFSDPAITLERCEELLRFHLKKNEEAVKRNVKVPLTQNQFDALVSFVHNLGEGSLKTSTLLRKLNEKCYSCAAEQFSRWSYAGGKFLQGLQNRRFDERRLFLS